MSFLKRIFGGAPSEPTARVVAQETYEGHLIEATPMKEGGQWRLCAQLSKAVGEETKRHELIRADLFQSETDAATAAVAKGRQVIDEQGDRLYG